MVCLNGDSQITLDAKYSFGIIMRRLCKKTGHWNNIIVCVYICLHLALRDDLEGPKAYQGN